MAAETIKDKQISKRKKTDKKKVADLVINKGLTQEQAGKIVNLSQNRISEIIKEVKENQNFLDFQNNKDKVFENLQYKLINLADDELLKTMLSKRGLTDAAILQDKIAQLRGQETPVNLTQIRILIDQRPQEAAQTVDVIPICSGDEDISRLCQLPIVPETA